MQRKRIAIAIMFALLISMFPQNAVKQSSAADLDDEFTIVDGVH